MPATEDEIFYQLGSNMAEGGKFEETRHHLCGESALAFIEPFSKFQSSHHAKNEER